MTSEKELDSPSRSARDCRPNGGGCLLNRRREQGRTRGRIMLILTRRVGERLLIGTDVQVTVLAVRGEQVRVGIAAPRHVPVHREEVYERIRQDQAAPKNE